MNHESISQIALHETFTVQPGQTARAVYAERPFGASYAGRLADVLCSAELLAQLEGICAAGLHPLLEWPRQRVLGASMSLQHKGPAWVGDQVDVRGFVQSVSRSGLSFRVEAHVGTRCVADAIIRFAIVDDSWPRARSDRQAAAARHG